MVESGSCPEGPITWGVMSSNGQANHGRRCASEVVHAFGARLCHLGTVDDNERYGKTPRECVVKDVAEDVAYARKNKPH